MALLDVNTERDEKEDPRKYPRKDWVSKAPGGKLATKLVHLTLDLSFLVQL